MEELIKYFESLEARIAANEERISTLEAELASMEAELDEVKSRPEQTPQVVEKVVEKIVEVPGEKIVEKIVVDETRVNELEGLLAEERRHTADLQQRVDETLKKNLEELETAPFFRSFSSYWFL